MLLKAEQLPAHLERGLAALYLLHGDEPLLVLEAADAIRQSARCAGYSEREVLTVLPGFDWGQLLAAGGNLSLFGDRKLIDLRIPNGKPGKEGSAALQEWCKRLSPDNLLLVTLPELDWREEKAAWYTALQQAGVALKLNAPPLAELPNWIAGRLRRQQQTVDMDGLKFIAERVEGNLLAAAQEVDKLALLAEGRVLDTAAMQSLVTDAARFDVFRLTDAALNGQPAQVSRVLVGLRGEGEVVVALLGMVVRELQLAEKLAQVQARGGNLNSEFRALRVWESKQALYLRALKRHDAPRWSRFLARAGQVDRIAKGRASGDAWRELERLLVAVAEPRAMKLMAS